MIAAAAHAFIIGKKVVGVHDHETGQDRLIAAEIRGGRLQGFDGDRLAEFGGRLPEIYDAGDDAHISLEIDGFTALGHDRGSKTHYSLNVTDAVVQLYDHGASAWFAFTVQARDVAEITLGRARPLS